MSKYFIKSGDVSPLLKSFVEYKGGEVDFNFSPINRKPKGKVPYHKLTGETESTNKVYYSPEDRAVYVSNGYILLKHITDNPFETFQTPPPAYVEIVSNYIDKAKNHGEFPLSDLLGRADMAEKISKTLTKYAKDVLERTLPWGALFLRAGESAYNPSLIAEALKALAEASDKPTKDTLVTVKTYDDDYSHILMLILPNGSLAVIAAMKDYDSLFVADLLDFSAKEKKVKIEKHPHTSLHSTIIPTRTTLPILQRVFISKGKAISTDLDYELVTDAPDGMDDGLYYIIDGRYYPDFELHPDDYPSSTILKYHKKRPVVEAEVTFTENDIKFITELAKEARIAEKGILEFSFEQGATFVYGIKTVAFWTHLNGETDGNSELTFFISNIKKFVKLITKLGPGKYSVRTYIDQVVIFEKDGITFALQGDSLGLRAHSLNPKEICGEIITRKYRKGFFSGNSMIVNIGTIKEKLEEKIGKKGKYKKCEDMEFLVWDER